MSKSMKKAVKKAYEELELEAGYSAGQKIMYTSVKLAEGLGAVRQFVVIGDRDLTFITVFPENAGQELERVCADVLELNYRLIMGSYDVDRSDGEIRFRSAVGLDSRGPSVDAIKRHIMLGLNSIRQFQDDIWQRHHAGNEGKGDTEGAIGGPSMDPMFK